MCRGTLGSRRGFLTSLDARSAEHCLQIVEAYGAPENAGPAWSPLRLELLRALRVASMPEAVSAWFGGLRRESEADWDALNYAASDHRALIAALPAALEAALDEAELDRPYIGRLVELLSGRPNSEELCTRAKRYADLPQRGLTPKRHDMREHLVRAALQTDDAVTSHQACEAAEVSAELPWCAAVREEARVAASHAIGARRAALVELLIALGEPMDDMAPLLDSLPASLGKSQIEQRPPRAPTAPLWEVPHQFIQELPGAAELVAWSWHGSNIQVLGPEGPIVQAATPLTCHLAVRSATHFIASYDERMTRTPNAILWLERQGTNLVSAGSKKVASGVADLMCAFEACLVLDLKGVVSAMTPSRATWKVTIPGAKRLARTNRPGYAYVLGAALTCLDERGKVVFANAEAAGAGPSQVVHRGDELFVIADRLLLVLESERGTTLGLVELPFQPHALVEDAEGIWVIQRGAHPGDAPRDSLGCRFDTRIGALVRADGTVSYRLPSIFEGPLTVELSDVTLSIVKDELTIGRAGMPARTLSIPGLGGVGPRLGGTIMARRRDLLVHGKGAWQAYAL
jgi:hypothetical protein